MTNRLNPRDFLLWGTCKGGYTDTMTETDLYVDEITGVACIKMRPVDWEEAHDEQVFTNCPMERTNVSITAFCATCPHFKGLAVPGVGRLAARLGRKEITAQAFSDQAAEILQSPSAVQVLCAYPVPRECGSFKEVNDGASTESG